MRRVGSTALKITIGLLLGMAIPAIAATPYMLLTLPTPGVTSGPLWAQQINGALTLIDQHNHAPGSGARVPTAGININADLVFGGYNATTLRSTRYSDNAAPLSLGADLRSIYSSGGNLYWNNGAGQQVQITSGPGLNAASVGAIGGDYATSTASEFYTSATQTFSFWQGPNKSASVDVGNLILRQPAVASPNGVTLKSPTSLAASYALTLPAALPAATSLVTFDNSGNVASTISSAAPTFTGQLSANGINSTNGAVYLNGAQTRYVLWDGTNYQIPGGQIQGISDPTTSSGAVTVNYHNTHGAARAWALLQTGAAGAVTVLKGYNVASASYVNQNLTVHLASGVPDTSCVIMASATGIYTFTTPTGCLDTLTVVLAASANFTGGVGTFVNVVVYN